MRHKQRYSKRKQIKKSFDKITIEDLSDADITKLDREPLLPFEKKDNDITIRVQAETDPNKGKDFNNLSVEELLECSVLCIDKSKGPTSHQVSDYTQKILKIKKAGHSGTLDPKVGGILATAISSATKVLQALLKSGKEYICICHLHEERSEEEIKLAMSRFIGKIQQLPPIKSAVKRRYRTREIYYINIIEIDGQDILFKIGCEAGTYIRKICSDLGEILGCGGHMASLRRTKAGPFNENTNMCTLQNLEDAYHFYKNENNDKLIKHYLMPVEKAVEHLNKIWIQDNAVKTICHGATLKVPGIVKYNSGIETDQLIAIMTLKNELICIAKALMPSNKIKDSKNGTVAKSFAVLMNRELYS